MMAGNSTNPVNLLFLSENDNLARNLCSILNLKRLCDAKIYVSNITNPSGRKWKERELKITFNIVETYQKFFG